MPVDSTTFRSVLGQWPSGVCVVTTTGPNGLHGMTASSFSSVSLDPPLVSVCLGNHLPSRTLLGEAGKFAISFLGKDQAHIGRRFAGQDREITDRFAGLDWIMTPNGCPVLSDAVAWLDCTVAHAYPGGDHTIFVGAVTEAALPRVISPLLFHSRNWGQVAQPLPATVQVRDTASPNDGLRFEFLTDGPHGLPSPDRVAAAKQAGNSVVGYVTDAFDPDREDEVLATIAALGALGCDEIGCIESDVTPASPLQVTRILQDAIVRVRPAVLRVRLAGHNRLALVNALVAMKNGVSHFDVVAPGAGIAGLPLGDLLHLSRQLEVAGPNDAADAAGPDLAHLRE
ncbi:flavin reductase (DIM6/NTAB) family NADH-FMN oxidoreductase RutF [Actinoplanes lutulentus]|uniref:Flavin reductase (DIM6/NTAB) family NADH-FMN oxidoreductase RutF n=1 Tax=Actinoplanes lutulentus TaxID=1287878 RepID=A0A327ZK45_9ACTN|nr:flavin reductase [Actinoplanes lutulentus]MBB2944392.1 flavin reductase (DIM6/NTAB) family NADH-FMN oxidoreductase RutF [Actinoplanes lutulentus]RAK42376.1 flavin reductase (DIM6/NTAB) family NADH-FMN oxidoreductase RutF [Actinoplanes lutulentus]